MPTRRVHVLIQGRVQGVGYRAWVHGEAERLGLTGWVRNLMDGRVEAVFHGSDGAVADMVSRCWSGPRLASVDAVDVGEPEADEYPGFKVLPDA